MVLCRVHMRKNLALAALASLLLLLSSNVTRSWSHPTSSLHKAQAYENLTELKDVRNEIAQRLVKLTQQRGYRRRRVDSNASVQCVDQWELDRQELHELAALYSQTLDTKVANTLVESNEEDKDAHVNQMKDLRVEMAGAAYLDAPCCCPPNWCPMNVCPSSWCGDTTLS